MKITSESTGPIAGSRSHPYLKFAPGQLQYATDDCADIQTKSSRISVACALCSEIFDGNRLATEYTEKHVVYSYVSTIDVD